MRNTAKKSLLVVAFLGLAGGAALLGGQDPAEVEIRIHPVAGSVSYLEGQGGNIGVSAGPHSYSRLLSYRKFFSAAICLQSYSSDLCLQI